MTEVILAIDGGATKTTITLRKYDGTVLFNGIGEGTNYQTVGVKKVKEVLSSLLAEVKSAFPVMRVDIAVFAFAGIDSERDKEIVRSIVEDICRSHQLVVGKSIVENDAESTMLGATGHQPGALLISGTGSIAYAHDAKGKIVRSGGWGHRAGDEGSGYWMGQEVLRAVFRMEDGRGPSTLLKNEVLKELNLSSVHDLAEWLFSSTYSVKRIAKLSTVLEICALSEDDVALRIVQEAAEELYLLTSSVLRQCKLGHELYNVYINGGAITHFNLLKNELEKQIKEQFPSCQIISSTIPPIEYIVARGWMAL